MAKRSQKAKVLRSLAPSSAHEAKPSRSRPTFPKLVAAAGIPFLLALVAFAVYGPSLQSDFASDARLEIDEGFVTSLSNLPAVFSLKVLGMHLMLSDRPERCFI